MTPRFWRRAEPFADSLIIFIAVAALIRPLFKARYLAFWGSIESTFIADARFLIEHWPHPQWQPLWYTGTRWDYIYPPALRYGTVLTSMTFGFLPVKAYHVYTAFFYCVGIVGVYFLIRTGMRSRLAAWLGAAAAALISPSFLFLTDIRKDAWSLAPQRLGVLVKYGEGPHITSVALLPFALAFAWRALERRRLWDLALAAVFCAAVVSHNFYGATSLAIFYSILVWSFIATKDAELPHGVHTSVNAARTSAYATIAIPVLAYGLTAAWFTPSYFRITTANMKLVAQSGNAWSAGLAAAIVLVFAAVSFRWARGRADRAWTVFVVGSALFFALDVIGNYYLHFRVYGEPLRLVPELDLALILAALLGIKWLWSRPGYLPRALAAAFVLGALATSLGYVRHAWSMFPVSPNYQDRVEYRVSEWLWKNMPNARVHAIGSVRFWFDAWHDLAELGGGSEQGLLNPEIELPQWEVTQGRDPRTAVLWLQCLGVDAVFVSDKRSQEVYKDFSNPAKFVGVLPVLYNDGQGNTIYKVPRRYVPPVRVVDSSKINAAHAPTSIEDVDGLAGYADIVEHGPDSPVTLAWEGSDAMRMHASVEAGQSLLVQESFDPAWQAWSGGRRLAVHPDAIGFMVVDAPPGGQDISLVFSTPLENRIGRIVTLLSLLAVGALLGTAAISRYR